MRPDGAGTDERVTPEQGRRRRPTDSMEWHIIKFAIAFAVVTTLIWGGIYFSKRAVMPDLSNAADAGQPSP